ncbi:MAG: hypothetical protein J6Q55_04265, partial [Clostridia bacterium]|nr:hypothetical protein [Clostridia bacterium]
AILFAFKLLFLLYKILEGIFALYKEALVPTVQGKQDFYYHMFLRTSAGFIRLDLLSLDKGLFTFKGVHF